jgi:hypothetical protein
MCCILITSKKQKQKQKQNMETGLNQNKIRGERGDKSNDFKIINLIIPITLLYDPTVQSVGLGSKNSADTRGFIEGMKLLCPISEVSKQKLIAFQDYFDNGGRTIKFGNSMGELIKLNIQKNQIAIFTSSSSLNFDEIRFGENDTMISIVNLIGKEIPKNNKNIDFSIISFFNAIFDVEQSNRNTDNSYLNYGEAIKLLTINIPYIKILLADYAINSSPLKTIIQYKESKKPRVQQSFDLQNQLKIKAVCLGVSNKGYLVSLIQSKNSLEDLELSLKCGQNSIIKFDISETEQTLNTPAMISKVFNKVESFVLFLKSLAYSDRNLLKDVLINLSKSKTLNLSLDEVDLYWNLSRSNSNTLLKLTPYFSSKNILVTVNTIISTDAIKKLGNIE